MKRDAAWVGYVWAAGGVALATGLFWLARGVLDKGHASLLYLPVVLACATRYGFGPAMLGAAGSFACWNYFFLPPYRTWTVEDPKDWLALFVFLAAALVTAQLAARARARAEDAAARERETAALQKVSEQIGGEADIARILPTLAAHAVALCRAEFCAIFVASPRDPPLSLAAFASARDDDAPPPESLDAALTVHAPTSPDLLPLRHAAPLRHRRLGLFLPLLADGRSWGVLHLGPRRDGSAFSGQEERLMRTLASYAAAALVRQSLSDDAMQAQALREADALKSDLLSLVSHELRTPLAAIKASTSGLLQEGAWSEREREDALRGINCEADRLSNLVGKLLDLSRLDAGAWRPDWDWCDLVDVLGTALARSGEAESARIMIDAPPELPLVRADPVQISQVISNLLENALKYAPDKTPVTVTIQENETNLQVDVADAGPGIPPAQADAIFDRFYRLDSHRQSGLPGTGLGLAICRGILTAHGGRIWERNGESGGAVFSFTLPRPSESETHAR